MRRKQAVGDAGVEMDVVVEGRAEAVQKRDAAPRPGEPEVQEAQRRLGTLFNASDYPQTLDGLFDLEVSYPTIGVLDGPTAGRVPARAGPSTRKV